MDKTHFVTKYIPIRLTIQCITVTWQNMVEVLHA